MLRRNFLCSAAVCGLALALPAIAFAETATDRADQATGGQNAAGGDNGAVEEIVVTTERRTVSVQKTPLALTALTPFDLEKKSVAQLSDLQNVSPSLSVTNTGLVSFVNIRGIGIASGSGSVVPGVATLRDGLYQPPILSHAAFYDIGDVEVLRGPQGTFIGTNSTGGAVLINSANPDFKDTYGKIQAQAGSYTDLGAQATINMPLTETLAVRFAFFYENHDSFYNNVGFKPTVNGTSFSNPGSLDEKAARLGILWKPTDDLQFLLKNEVLKTNTGGFATKPLPGTSYYSLASTDPFTLNFDQPTQNDETGTKTSLEIKYKLDNGITFRSLTGYQYNAVSNLYDVDSVTAPATAALPDKTQYQNITQKPFTQEINILSPSDDRFTWIVGASYLHTNTIIGINQTQLPAISYLVINESIQRKEASGFGQIGYALTDDLTVKAGMRYSRAFDTGAGGVYAGGAPYAGQTLVTNDGYHKEHELTGKVEASYQLTPDHYLYAFGAKGFKEGGYNTAPNATTVPVQFAPEVVYDYEAGIKSSWFDGHLKTQFGGFYMDYQNLQISTIDPLTGRASIRNVAKSTIEGFEFAAQTKYGGWDADLNGSYVYSALSSLTIINGSGLPSAASAHPQCNGSNASFCFDYTPYLRTVSGKADPYSPRYSFSGSLGYGFVINNDDVLTPRVTVAYQSSQWATNLEVRPADYIAGHTLVNLNLTLLHGPYTIMAYATNLFNKAYESGQASPSEFFGDPRQYGVRVAREF